MSVRTRHLLIAPSVLLTCVCTLALASSSALGFKSFQTPSHNIACVMFKTGVRCDIARHSWKAPPKPKSCDLDYGNGLSLSTHGRATYTCAGDTILHMGAVLPYGQSKTKGRFHCTSMTTGVRCVNARNGHGFFLSRQVARRF
jgi:hypothetical protein